MYQVPVTHKMPNKGGRDNRQHAFSHTDKPKEKPDFADINLPGHVKVCEHRCQQAGPEMYLSGLICEGLQTRSTELPERRAEREGRVRAGHSSASALPQRTTRCTTKLLSNLCFARDGNEGKSHCFVSDGKISCALDKG